MNAGWMLNLYPRTWRGRHGDALRARFADRAISPIDALALLGGALEAHLRPRPTDHPGPAPVSVARRPRSAGLQALFFAHLSLFVALNVVLFLINLLTTPGTWWSLYVVWSWGMALALHAGLMFPWRGLFGAHLAFATILGAGLIAINVAQGGGPWSIWPAVTLGTLVVAHALVAFRRLTLLQAHALATAVATAELLAVLIAVGADEVADVIIVVLQLWLLVLTHWLIRIRNWTLFGAHVVIYAGTMALLAVNNATGEPGEWWVRYPLVAWGALVVAHGLAVRGVMRRPTSPGRFAGLRQHVAGIALGAAIMGLLDLVDGTATWWAVWPIGAWLVLLAVHAGAALLPYRLAGVHLFAWLAGSVALISVDAITGGGLWWYWPVLWWGVVLAAHAGSLLTMRPLPGMHLAGGLALIIAMAITDRITGPPAWWFYPAAAVLLSGVIHIGLRIDPARIARQGAAPHDG